MKDEAGIGETGTVMGEGSCSCGATLFRVNAAPIFTHCCHCGRCQRQNGSAFALNAIVETSALELLAGQVEKASVPTESGSTQDVVRCAKCKTALWSHYNRMGSHAAFVRVGTLENRAAIKPDIHIFTTYKQPWVSIPPSDRQVPDYYDAREYWPPESLQRLQNAKKASG